MAASPYINGSITLVAKSHRSLTLFMSTGQRQLCCRAPRQLIPPGLNSLSRVTWNFEGNDEYDLLGWPSSEAAMKMKERF